MSNTSLAGRSDLHIARKLWHIFCGCAAVGTYFVSGIELHFWGWVALAIAIGGFLLDFLRLNNKKFNEFAIKVLAPIMRKSEKESFSGLPFYALGISLSIYFYQKDIALISILYLVFSDPISSFFGVQFGKDQILPNKSLQGTIAGFFSCYFITIIYLANNPTTSLNLLGFSLLAALIGTISELFSAFNIDDNITIPVVSGAGLTVLNYLFQIF
jgi:diacylglycerol kinase (CTP)